MSEHILAARQKALEDAFFNKKDLELLAKIREKIRAERENELLMQLSGVVDEQVVNHLREAGVRADTWAAMALVPLVLVAWADGDMAEKEKEAILKAAEEEGVGAAGTPARELLEHWLAAAPEDDLGAAWKEYLSALLPTLDPEARKSLHDQLLQRAKQVASAAGGLLGIGKISASEHRVLEELTQILEA